MADAPQSGWGGTPTGSSSGGTSGWGGTPLPSGTRRNTGGGGILGTLERIPGDTVHGAANFISGVIPGTIKLAGDVVQGPSLAEVGREWRDLLLHGDLHSYKGDPLTTQDIPGIKQNLVTTVEHPLRDPVNTALWVLPVAAGVSGRVAAVKMLPADATAAERTAAAISGQYAGPEKTITARLAHGGAEVPVRTLPRQGFRAARMIGTDKALKALTRPETRVVGEFSRAARALKRDTLPVEMRLTASEVLHNYHAAYAALGAKQRVALAILGRLPLEADVNRWREILPSLDPAAQKLVRRLDDPKIMRYYREWESNPRMVRAHAASVALGELQTKVKIAQGALTPEIAEAAKYRHMRVARGATFEPLKLPVDETTPVGANVRISGQKVTGKLVEVNGKEATVFYPRFSKTVKVPAASLEHELRPSLHGGGTPEELAAEVAAANRPQPFYIPDVPASRQPGFAGRSSAMTPPSLTEHAFTGELFRRGLIAIHTDTLGPDFLRTAVRDRQIVLNQRIIDAAIPSPNGNLLPGYRWVRETRGQKIPFTATAYGEHMKSFDEAFPEPDLRLTASDAEAQGLAEGEIATDAKGQRLMIPEQAARTLEADLAKGSKAIRRIIAVPLKLWRALILNLRVPWLVNNVVGNTLLATVRFAGPDGLRAVLGMIRETKGAQAAARAVGMAESSGSGLTKEDIVNLLPQQSRSGTFIGQNLPTGLLAKAPTAVQKAAKVPGQIIGFLPRIDRATEAGIRRVSVNTVLRGTPEVQALYRAMPKQTRSWRAAMQQGLKDQNVARLVNREVNDALGDFLSLTPTEANAIRNLIPFYAWFREILRITAKLPIDAPGRTLLLARVSQIGNQWAQETLGPLPTYLQGAVALGKPQGDIQGILALRSSNPYTSAVDVARSGGAFLPGGTAANANQLLGELNPFIQAGIEALGAVSSPNQGTPKSSRYGLAYDAARGVFSGLPESRIYTVPPSRLYPNRSREDLALQFLGDLRRHISLQQAHYNASQGK